MKRNSLKTALIIATATLGLSACAYYPAAPGYAYYPGYYAPAYGPAYGGGSVVIDAGGGGYWGHGDHHGWR